MGLFKIISEGTTDTEKEVEKKSHSGKSLKEN